MSFFFFFNPKKKLYKVVELVGKGLLSTGPTPSSFFTKPFIHQKSWRNEVEAPYWPAGLSRPGRLCKPCRLASHACLASLGYLASLAIPVGLEILAVLAILADLAILAVVAILAFLQS